MRRGAAIFITLLLFPLALSPAEAQEGSDASRCPALEYMAGVGEVCRLPSGLLEVFAPNDGRSLGFTHGPDPRCALDCHAEGQSGPSLAMSGSTTPHCVAGTSSEYFVRVIYARATDDTDRYASMVGTIRNLVAGANAMVDDAAIATGDRLSIRTKCASGIVVVDNVVLPTRRAVATYASVINDLENLGYTSIRQKHWVYYDDAGACACAGIGHIYTDESNSVNNANNGASGTQAMFAISFDSPAVRTLLHELGHTLGAVQDGAPRSSRAGHCTDGRDTMCYNDGGANSAACQPDFTCSGVCSVEVFDCNKDTYCNANPAPGSYLATRWQACSRLSRFLQYGANVAPEMTSLSCPASVQAETSLFCSFSASDGNLGVFYNVDWGDGTTSRVPATGTVTPGTTQQAAHTYATQGGRTVRVSATDSGTPQMTSSEMTTAVTVTPPNTAPTMAGLSCAPSTPSEGETVTCEFSATDEGDVSYQVSWGDGAPTTRVPGTGAVAQGALQQASHVYGRGGAFPVSVTATDTSAPAKTSAPRSVTLQVTEVNTPPEIVSFSCTPTLRRPGEPISCTFRANDDSPGVRYTLDWGDGTTESIPASGHVVPGVTQSRQHAYAAPGEFSVTLFATDDFSPPASSEVAAIDVSIFEDISGPTIVLTDPQAGMAYRGCAQQFSKATGRPLMITRGCVRADITDLSGVARVEVVHDGVVVAVALQAPYVMEFPIPLAATGVAYQVRAYDTLGYVRTERFVIDAIFGTE